MMLAALGGEEEEEEEEEEEQHLGWIHQELEEQHHQGDQDYHKSQDYRAPTNSFI